MLEIQILRSVADLFYQAVSDIFSVRLLKIFK